MLVEQRTGFLNSRPCAPGSIPGGTTEKRLLHYGEVFFCYARHEHCLTSASPEGARIHSLGGRPGQKYKNTGDEETQGDALGVHNKTELAKAE